ncbi:MAG TPA: DNRLRE domain-containing protein, partial [Myxococcota bacterium]|nr:DNRLRE domain-containing protein [Myxococcota bacterium]
MLRRLMTWAGVVAIAFVGSAASANTITIGASRDATIFQNNVDNSNGAGPGMFSGTNGAGSPRRGLIDFDIAGNVPAGSTITSVQLTLFLAQVAGGGGGSADTTPRTIELHLLTSNWGEGTTGMGLPLAGSGQGFPANAGDATWNARMFPSTLWGTAGGDFNASASASTLVG